MLDKSAVAALQSRFVWRSGGLRRSFSYPRAANQRHDLRVGKLQKSLVLLSTEIHHRYQICIVLPPLSES